MSNQPLLVTGEAVADASVDALLATAHALAREAANRMRSGTADTSREGLIDQAVVCQQVQNSMWAVQSARLAQVAAIEEVVSSDGPPREVRHALGSYADEWLPSEIGTRLGWSDRQATTRLTESVDAIRRTPRLFDLTARGTLDSRKLVGVGDTLCGASPKVAGKVERELLATFGDVDDVVLTTSTKLIRRSRRLLAQAAPADADKAATERRANAKGVQVFPHHEPGLSVFRAVLPSEDAMRVMAGVNELARHLHKDTTTGKSLDECRVDAFVDLLLGNISVGTTCVVQIPLFPIGSATDGAVSSGRADSEEADTTVRRPAVRAGLAAAMSAAGRHLSCESSAPAAPSFAEARLQHLLELSAAEGIDRLVELNTPTSNVIVREPCDVTTLVRREPGVRFAPSVRVDLRSRGPSCRRLHGTDDLQGVPERRHRTTSATTGSPADAYRIGDAVIEGLGVIPAAALIELCGALGTKVTRALIDMKTGATVETADGTYKPGARLRRFVVTRDQHCRFPGCTRPARLDDLDHVDPYPDGPTAAWNLQCLCRHHHRAKHEGGWAVSMTSEGVCTWTSPSGRRYVTHPAD